MKDPGGKERPKTGGGAEARKTKAVQGGRSATNKDTRKNKQGPKVVEKGKKKRNYRNGARQKSGCGGDGTRRGNMLANLEIDDT